MSSGSNIRPYISRDEIDKAVNKLASEINRDYHGRNPVILGVLLGSFVFMADLVRRLDMPLETDFVRLSSYGSGTVSTGCVQMTLEPSVSLNGRDVLVVEDIADTGNSISFLMKYLEKQEPGSLKLCVLADKPSRRKVPVKIDYRGFTVQDEFFIGYGLDYNGQYRNIPELCILGDMEE